MASQLHPRLPLIRAMKHRGVSTNDLARQIGIHAGTLSRVRTGRQRPGVATAALLADALGCSAAELGLAVTEGGAV